MKRKIIHISIDEKFINIARWQFESINVGVNFFYVLVADINKPLRHIEKNKNIILFEDYNLILNQISDCDICVLHSLNPQFYRIVESLPLHVKCIWMCFGFEVYNDIKIISRKNILSKQTRKKFKQKRPDYKRVFKEMLYPIHRFLFKSNYYSTIAFKKIIISRINYIATSFEEEYLSVKSLLKIDIKSFNFAYYPLEKIIEINEDLNLNRPNILIGNSGALTGNHLDVFYKIQDYSFLNQKIIAPLGYGNNAYIDEMITIGNQIFKEKFQPITSFLPLDDYNRLIKTCGISIFNNYRQQAVGNTIALLWHGSKVFLNTKNTFYHFLKRIGIFIYDIDKDLNAKSITELLSIEEVNKNRAILHKYFSSDILLKNLEDQIKLIDV